MAVGLKPYFPPEQKKLVDRYEVFMSERARNGEVVLTKEEIYELEEELESALSVIEEIRTGQGSVPIAISHKPAESSANKNTPPEKPAEYELELAEGLTMEAPAFNADITEIISGELKLRRVKGLPTCPENLVAENALAYANWIKDSGEMIALVSRHGENKGAFVPLYIIDDLIADKENAQLGPFQNVHFQNTYTDISERMEQGLIAVFTTRDGGLAALIPASDVEKAKSLIYNAPVETPVAEVGPDTGLQDNAPETSLQPLYGKGGLTENLRFNLRKAEEAGLPLIMQTKEKKHELLLLSEKAALELIAKHNLNSSKMPVTEFYLNFKKIREGMQPAEIIFLTSRDITFGAISTPELLDIAMKNPAAEEAAGSKETPDIPVQPEDSAAEAAAAPDNTPNGFTVLSNRANAYLQQLAETGRPVVVKNSIGYEQAVLMTEAQGLKLQADFSNLVRKNLPPMEFTLFGNALQKMNDNTLFFILQHGKVTATLASREYIEVALDMQEEQPPAETPPLPAEPAILSKVALPAAPEEPVALQPQQLPAPALPISAPALKEEFFIQNSKNITEVLGTLNLAIAAAISNIGTVAVKSPARDFAVVADPEFVEYVASFEPETLKKAPEAEGDFGIHTQNINMTLAFSAASKGQNVLVNHALGQVAFVGDTKALDAYRIIKAALE